MKKLILHLAACFLASAAIAADSSTSPVFQMRLVLDAPSDDSEQMPLITRTVPPHTNVLHVQRAVLLDQTALKSARLTTDALGQPVIEVIFTDRGGQRFAEVTRQNVRKRLAIIIGGKVCEAPTILGEISGGKAQITGDFSKQEAKDLTKKIRASLAKK